MMQRPEVLHRGFLADYIVSQRMFVFFLPDMCSPGAQQLLFRSMTQHANEVGKQMKVMGYFPQAEVRQSCWLEGCLILQVCVSSVLSFKDETCSPLMALEVPPVVLRYYQSSPQEQLPLGSEVGKFPLDDHLAGIEPVCCFVTAKQLSLWDYWQFCVSCSAQLLSTPDLWKKGGGWGGVVGRGGPICSDPPPPHPPPKR